MRPGDVPTPEHHHLPGWVRRVHAQARPILADLLGNLIGEPREQYEREVADLIGAISGGKFSQAWQYPGLIARGEALFQANRREVEDHQKTRRALETSRRKVADQLRDNSGRLPGDLSARLGRALRAAEVPEAVQAVGTELDQALSSARTVEEKRRDREIDRTRERIRRALPRGAADEPAQTETWQDALRRLSEQFSE